jgi:2-polyprenyl-6-hydroxyphenyl methylase/3-demethylubiquinone-9 3-methyltransferase
MTAANENVDAAELAKFSALAHRWWDPHSEFRPLHDINPLRLEWISARSALAAARVVDVGCGGGLLAEALACRGANVLGIDLADKPLGVARLHQLETGVSARYENIAAEALAQREPGEFDVATCMELLEHVPDPASTVRACATLVRAGGSVFFSTINRNPKSYLFAVIGAEYLLRLLPRGTHDYSKFITPSELARDCREAGLVPREFCGLGYNPLTGRYALANDTSVNYMLHAVKAGIGNQKSGI